MRKMGKTIQKPTDEEINRIDNILDQLDELLKQLPEDYQRDYALDLCSRFDIKLDEDEI